MSCSLIKHKHWKGCQGHVGPEGNEVYTKHCDWLTNEWALLWGQAQRQHWAPAVLPQHSFLSFLSSCICSGAGKGLIMFIQSETSTLKLFYHFFTVVWKCLPFLISFFFFLHLCLTSNQTNFNISQRQCKQQPRPQKSTCEKCFEREKNPNLQGPVWKSDCSTHHRMVYHCFNQDHRLNQDITLSGSISMTKWSTPNDPQMLNIMQRSTEIQVQQ